MIDERGYAIYVIVDKRSGKPVKFKDNSILPAYESKEMAQRQASDMNEKFGNYYFVRQYKTWQ